MKLLNGLMASLLIVTLFGRPTLAQSNDCGGVLLGGLYEITQTSSQSELDQIIDNAFFKEHESSEREGKGGGGGVSVGYGGFSIGLSGGGSKQKLKEVSDRNQGKSFKDFSRTDKETVYKMVAAEHAPRLIEAYEHCLTNSSKEPQVASLKRVRGQQMEVRFWWHELRQDNPKGWPAISAITCKGGEFVGEPPKPGSKLDRSYSLLVQRDPMAEQVTILIQTDRGDQVVTAAKSDFSLPSRSGVQRGDVRLPKETLEWTKVTEDDKETFLRRYVHIQFDRPFVSVPVCGLSRFDAHPAKGGKEGSRGLVSAWTTNVTERGMTLVIRAKHKDDANNLRITWMAVGELADDGTDGR